MNTAQASATLLSFPKSGRTWLLAQVTHYTKQYFGLDEIVSQKPDSWHTLDPRIPRFRIVHDDDPHLKEPEELLVDKSEFNQDAVLLLVRDPRDVIVSLYFEMTRRTRFHAAWGFDVSKFPSKSMPIGDFIRNPRGGFQALLRYYEIWNQASRQIENFACVRYEDLQSVPEETLSLVLQHWNLPVDPTHLANAVQSCQFDQMQRKEAQGAYSTLSLTPADPDDPESFKVRRGKIGGYVDYLSEEDIAFMNTLCAKLPPLVASYRGN